MKSYDEYEKEVFALADEHYRRLRKAIPVNEAMTKKEAFALLLGLMGWVANVGSSIGMAGSELGAILDDVIHAHKETHLAPADEEPGSDLN